MLSYPLESRPRSRLRARGVRFFIGLTAVACLFAWASSPAHAAAVVGNGVFAAQPATNLYGAKPGAALNPEDDAFLDDLERASFHFFDEQTDPHTGLVRDRARADGSPSEGKASIASEGFALDAWVIASYRGWVGHDEARDRVRSMLRFLAEEAPRRHGFFYHFMEMQSGARAWDCEVSSIDTGILAAGAIVARDYFNDPEITAYVNQIYGDIDWKWFLNEGNLLALSWYDEHGFSRYRWSNYSEQILVSLLALGSNTHGLDAESWRAWSRTPTGNYAGFHYIMGAPLFMHQYPYAYFDLRDKRDSFVDYYHNSVLATLSQRQFCMDLRSEFPSWGERLWGVTASDSADGYKAWGGPPRTWINNSLDGSIVPAAAAGSVPFAPYETMMVLHHEKVVFGDRIWKRYGFVDAFNPETGWVDSDVVGVDVGISLVQAENARTGLIWALFMEAPEAQAAIQKAGFVSTSTDLTLDQTDRLKGMAREAWDAMNKTPVTAKTIGLRLTAIPAANDLGLVSGDDAIAMARSMLEHPPIPTDDVSLAKFAAGLIVLRQSLHGLAPRANALLESIHWDTVALSSTKLGSASRLAAFFQTASGNHAGSAWQELTRMPEAVGPVYVLSPATAEDQLLPGLWLDERDVITGASAAQMAYAIARGKSPNATSWNTLMAVTLEVKYFVTAALDQLAASPPPPLWIQKAGAEAQAAFVTVVANLIVPDCIYESFQQDPLVRSGRSLVPEFAEQAFGRNDSILWMRELSGPVSKALPERLALAVATNTPRDAWSWTSVSGSEYSDSSADIRPGDPPLTMRFAFTWDNRALHYHVDVSDTPVGYLPPTGRDQAAELLINPRNDGFVWGSADDFLFRFQPVGGTWEWFHNRRAPAKVTATQTGYSVDADIPWSVLGVTPKPGLEICISPAAVAGAAHEWEPSPKLNWCYRQRPDDRVALGTLRLQ